MAKIKLPGSKDSDSDSDEDQKNPSDKLKSAINSVGKDKDV